MPDYQDKYRERWQDRRKKGYNWKKLAIMVLALVGLLILMNRLGRMGSAQTPAGTEFIDSSAVYQDSLSQADTPPAPGDRLP
ncbi:MAG TPA: hypothetical protein PKH19_02060 [Candidatus Syntrophosphaera sp.]|nr:hypothetical protein [Candidatus Syntrophosphaera sp.]